MAGISTQNWMSHDYGGMITKKLKSLTRKRLEESAWGDSGNAVCPEAYWKKGLRQKNKNSGELGSTCMGGGGGAALKVSSAKKTNLVRAK